eukprot:g3054.t1
MGQSCMKEKEPDVQGRLIVTNNYGKNKSTRRRISKVEPNVAPDSPNPQALNKEPSRENLSPSNLSSSRPRRATTRINYRRYPPDVQKANMDWAQKIQISGFRFCRCDKPAPLGWRKFDLAPMNGHVYVSVITGDKVKDRPNEEKCTYKEPGFPMGWKLIKNEDGSEHLVNIALNKHTEAMNMDGFKVKVPNLPRVVFDYPPWGQHYIEDGEEEVREEEECYKDLREGMFNCHIPEAVVKRRKSQLLQARNRRSLASSGSVGDKSGGDKSHASEGVDDESVGDDDKSVGDGNKSVGDGEKSVADSEKSVGDGDKSVADSEKSDGDNKNEN